MNVEIKDKVALITGANRGIGKAIVESFISHGVKKVYLAVRNIESTHDLVSQYGSKLVPIHVDMSKPESIVALAKAANDVQILVNNAGILLVSDPFSDDAEEKLQQEFQTNTFGLLRIARAFTPVLERNGGAAFVQLNSVASIKNFLPFTTYSASKAASYSITQGLKESLQPKGIAVLSVHPGPIATDMADNAGMGDVAEPASLVSEAIVRALISGDFHVFPDSVAKNFESAYQSYAKTIIEAVA